MKIHAQLRQADGLKTCEQQRFSIPERALQRGVDGLFYRASGRFGAVPHCERLRFTQGPIHVEQGDAAEIARDGPPAAMTFFGTHEALVAQTAHDAANDDRIRLHGARHRFRRDGAIDLGHVQKNVENT